MNIRRVEYFLNLAKSQNLHHASEILHISPPALSKAMKLLEEELGVTLWVRSGRKMILSDAGKSFVKELTKWMEDLGDIRKKIDIGSKEKAKFALPLLKFFLPTF